MADGKVARVTSRNSRGVGGVSAGGRGVLRYPAVRGSGPESSRGQSLAEFAIVFRVMFLIVGAIIQFGLVFWAQNGLTQVVRDIGRWEATQQVRPCNSNGAAVVTKANEIARTSGLFAYTNGHWTSINGGVPYAFDVSPAPRDGIEVSWPLSVDSPPPGGYISSDCPPDTNQVAWFVNIRAHHEVPLFLPFIGLFIPSCDADSCSLSSSVQFRMEPSR
jgi:hypothetical protein